MNVVIDADGMLYRSGFAAEKRTYIVQGNEFETKARALDYMREFGVEGKPVVRVEAEPVAHVMHTLKLQIQKIQDEIAREYGALQRTVVVLSGPENYRYGIATIRPYKGNRDPDHKPIYMQQMRDFLRHKYGAMFSNGVEADDVVAQIATKNRGRIVIAGMDKDLLQVPGLHYHYTHERHFEIGDKDGLCNLYEQIIAGDPTDNIIGCYRAGPRAAEALVYNIREAHGHDLRQLERGLYLGALSCYEQSIEKFPDCPYSHMTAQDALHETARLVYLKRSKDDEWNPPELQ